MQRIQNDPEPQPEVPSLLLDYAEQAERKAKIKKGLVLGVPATLFALAVLELLITKTPYLLLAEVSIIGFVALVTIMVSYSFFVFWLAWGFAGACQRKGQTRIAIPHFIGITMLSLVAAGVFGAITFRPERLMLENIALPFFLFWMNVGLGCVGYFFRFYKESIPD